MDEADHTGYTGLSIATGRVLPEWIDFIGHMNVAYYVLAFDLGVDDMWNELGITREYMEKEQCSTFAVECHITYQKELQEDDPFKVTSQILAFDEKRIHQFQRMYHAEHDYLAATAEWMNLHVDLETRRVTPFPGPILSALGRFAERQGALPKPVEAGKVMRIEKPIFAGVEQ
jgi:acyl-CoA thioester hydrolase